MTSSTRYFVVAGSTSPDTRLMPISAKPSARIPRRGLMSTHTSGKDFQACLAFAAAVLTAVESSLAIELCGASRLPFQMLRETKCLYESVTQTLASNISSGGSCIVYCLRHSQKLYAALHIHPLVTWRGDRSRVSDRSSDSGKRSGCGKSVLKRCRAPPHSRKHDARGPAVCGGPCRVPPGSAQGGAR